MVNAIGTSGVNSIQMFNAVNAFKSSGQIQEDKSPDISDGLEINDSNILENQNLDEIKKFAQIAGEENLSNEDIQYGVTYGRSVIADYVI